MKKKTFVTERGDLPVPKRAKIKRDVIRTKKGSSCASDSLKGSDTERSSKARSHNGRD